MKGVDKRKTLKELFQRGIISSKTYYSLLRYKCYCSVTPLYIIERDLDKLYTSHEVLEELKSILGVKENIAFNTAETVSVFDHSAKKDISFNTTLKELFDNGYISVRSYNVLRFDASLEYTDDTTVAIIKRDFSNPSDLLKLRNFGKKSLFELTNVFHHINDVEISTKDQAITEEHTSTDNPAKSVIINDYVFSIITSSYVNAFSKECIFTSFIKSLYPTAKELHIKILNNYHILYSIYEEFDIAGNIKIRQYFISYIRNVIQNFLVVNSSNKDTYKIYVQAENELSNYTNFFSYTDRFKYFLDEFKKQTIIDFYKSQCNTFISIRSKHFLEKYLPAFENFLPCLDKSEGCLFHDLSRFICIKSKTLVEIAELCSKMRDEFHHVENNENHTLSLASLKCKFPYLIMKQREFVLDFLNQYGSLPHFYILYQYLYAICSSSGKENQRIKIFCSLCGLFDGVEKTLEEVATNSQLSRERVRQLSTGKEVRKELSVAFPIDIYEYLELSKKLYFYNDDPDYLMLKENQNLLFDFRSFAILFCLYSDHRYVNYKGYEILVSNKIFKTKPLEKILDNIIYRSTLRHPMDERVSVYEFISKNSKYLLEKKRLLYRALENIIPTYIELEEDHIVFKQNCIHVTTELVKILEEKGEVMFLQDLFIAFKSKYPGHKIDTAEKLRPYIKKPLKAIGKQSRYGLETWENIYWGNIRDLLTECLMNSEDPVHIDELLKVVLVHYPNTNVKNIVSTLASDELGRFVQFKGGFYGLERRFYNEKFIKSSIVRRHSFADRLSMFTDFIESYHRFPFSNGGEIEASLQRWYNNVLSGAIEVTDEEISELSNIIDYYEGLNYPKNAFEANFLNKCEEFKTFVLENHCLPSLKKGKELYGWFRQSKENMNSYTDKRRLYFLDLLLYISSYGFRV